MHVWCVRQIAFYEGTLAVVYTVLLLFFKFTCDTDPLNILLLQLLQLHLHV